MTSAASRPTHTRPAARNRIGMTLAVLALALKVMIPAGFMAAPARTTGLTLVLCTGHGPLTIRPSGEPTDGKTHPPGKMTHEAPCMFAGHGAAAPAPDLGGVQLAGLAPAAGPVAAPSRKDLAPGRGLAAPPPPSRGPPPALT